MTLGSDVVLSSYVLRPWTLHPPAYTQYTHTTANNYRMNLHTIISWDTCKHQSLLCLFIEYRHAWVPTRHSILNLTHRLISIWELPHVDVMLSPMRLDDR